MKRYRKVADFNYEFATRDEREIEVVRGYTSDIAILSLAGENTNASTSAGTPIIRLSPVGKKYGKIISYVLTLPRFVKLVASENPDILSCHDLKALLIGYLAALGCKKKPLLVYDAHEYELGRNSALSRKKTMHAAKVLLERFLASRCVFVIAVNDSIADEMQRVHMLSRRPIVARSTPFYWRRNESEAQRARGVFCSQLDCDSDSTFLMMYHGGVMPGRGVERLFEALAKLPAEFKLVVLGNGEEKYLRSLRAYAEECDVYPRVLFHSAVPREELEGWVAAADVGMVTVEAVSESYRLMLPNKFFENVQAEVPIVASNFPETGRLVQMYDIGLLCDPSDASDIAACVLKISNNNDMYHKFKANLVKAKHDLCWEKERETLVRAYAEITTDEIKGTS